MDWEAVGIGTVMGGALGTVVALLVSRWRVRRWVSRAQGERPAHIEVFIPKHPGMSRVDWTQRIYAGHNMSEAKSIRAQARAKQFNAVLYTDGEFRG